MPRTQILISAGEASGDMYAARLAKALGERADVHLFGMGGPRMREAGVEIVADCAEVSLVGLQEIARKLPALNRVWRRLLAEARRRKPPLAILTDFPGFHLHLSRALKRMGVRNIYFICPQFWAWRPRRANLVRRRFELGLCIFPFEVDWYEARGVKTKFIGHPLVGEVAARRSRIEFLAAEHLNSETPTVALLPGSRAGELSQHLPVMLEACRRILVQRKVQFVLALAPGLSAELLRPFLRETVPVRVVENTPYDALGASDVAIVSSGTATVETALMDTPMVVIYRVAPLTAAIARRLVRTPMFAMVNLIAGRRVVPELIQEELTPDRLAAETLRILTLPDVRTQMRKDLSEVRAKLGPPGAIERAAAILAEMIPPG